MLCSSIRLCCSAVRVELGERCAGRPFGWASVADPQRAQLVWGLIAASIKGAGLADIGALGSVWPL